MLFSLVVVNDLMVLGIATACGVIRIATLPYAGAPLKFKHEGISKFWMNFLNITGCVSESLKVSSKT